MSSEPLVSIAMPCYNASQTLPMALASLLAQTYENWECLLVDDGSTDQPRDVVDQAGDSRIRYIPLDRNYGRGVARQVALDRAKGELLGMLDADDWYYPTKIEQQLEVLVSEPKLTLVSGGMAIVDENHQIVGVRCRGSAGETARPRGPLKRLASPPVAHGPSMIRMEIAKQIKYDASMHRSEDSDFLLGVLMGRYFCVMSSVSYVYSEHASLTLEGVLDGYAFRRHMFRKYRRKFPVSSRVNIGMNAVKEFVCRAVFAAGLGRSLIERRSQEPSPEDIGEYGEARRTVMTHVDRVFQQAGQQSMAR